MKKTLFSIVFVLAVLSAFAGGKKDSLSFEQLEKKYPSSQYIVALGQGANLANAQSSAKMSICQTLGETLKGESLASQTSKSDGTDSSSLKIDVNETVLFEHITGIELKENWQTNGGKGDWICVAVLDRKQASSYYAKLAKENDLKILELTNQADKKGAGFESLELYENAVSMAEENQYNLDLLLALNQSAYRQTVMLYGSVQSLETKQKNLASKLKVLVKIENDSDGMIASAFKTSLLKRGISVVEDNADYFIEGTVNFEPVDSLDGKNVFVRYSLDCPLTDSAKNVIKPYNFSGREGHLSLTQAKQRAYVKIATEIRQ